MQEKGSGTKVFVIIALLIGGFFLFTWIDAHYIQSGYTDYTYRKTMAVLKSIPEMLDAMMHSVRSH